MALLDFIIKKSATAPSITDFYDSMSGYFYGWDSNFYIPVAGEYEIDQIDIHVWVLRIDPNISRVIDRFAANNRNILYVNPACFGVPLKQILLKDNLISSSNIDEMLHYWATDIPDYGDYITSAVFVYTGNSEYRTDASDGDVAILVNDRGWYIEHAAPPAPTPTSSVTPYPTRTPTKTPTATPTLTPTHVRQLSVLTVAGIGTPGDGDGVLGSNYCYINSTPTPSNSPTPTPTLISDINVHTIAGTGRSGDADGDACYILPPVTPTVSNTPTNTPTSTNEPHLRVITIGGCPVPTPSVSVSPTYTGVIVRTVAGVGVEGDLDGDSCLLVRPSPTPTKTATPTVTPSNTSTVTPTPSNTSTVTPTVTPTNTQTPTNTCSVTPSSTATPYPTPTITPSAEPHCVVVTPKIQEPCCEEPATILGYGSTTYNSKISSYSKLADRIKKTLGYPLIQLEVTDDQIYSAIDISLELFTKFSGFTEEYLIFNSSLYKPGYGLPIGDLFSITPEMQNNPNYKDCDNLINASAGYDVDLNDRRIVMNVFTVQPGDNSGINTLFTIEQTIAQQAYFGHLLGNVGFDLITFDVLKIWLKTREKVLALKPYFRFYPERQLLRLTPEPETRNVPYFGIIGAYVQKPIRELISQLWIYKYTMAQIKLTMGHVRGKYPNSPLYGGGSVNAADVMSQGLKEMDELEKELKTDLIDREPIPFFVG